MRPIGKQTFEWMSAYSNGYYYGRSNLPLRHLWQPEEVKGHYCEELGYYWGQNDYYMFDSDED